VLFINVFGTWNGSFGVDTEAGDHKSNSGAVAGTSTSRGGQGGEGPTGSSAPQSSVSSSDVKVYGLTSTDDGGYRAVALASSNVGGQGGAVAGTSTTSSDAEESDENNTGAVLGDSVSGELEGTGQGQISVVTIGLTILALSAALTLGNRALIFIGSRRRP
jgi:hypothetical protein